MIDKLHAIPLAQLNAVNLEPLSDDSLVVLIGKLSRECWTCDDPMQDADERKNGYAVSGRLGRVGADRSVAILAYGQGPLPLRQVDSRTFEWLLRGTGTATLAERCVFQHVLACRLLFARTLDEAKRRGILPTHDDMRVAWDLAQLWGRVQTGADARLTLAEAWAASRPGVRLCLDVFAWLVTEASLLQVVLEVSVDGVTHYVYGRVDEPVNGNEVARQLNALDTRGTWTANGNNITYSENVPFNATVVGHAFDSSDAAQADLERWQAVHDERPASRPIGRNLARRLERGRRRGR